MDAYSAYAQDGIDDGIREGASTVATDDVRGTDALLYKICVGDRFFL